MEEPLECELCCGVLAFMGTLGRRQHYRCVNCAMDWSFLVMATQETTDDESVEAVQLGSS